ncbi:hypothetical protein [Maribellus sp. YY47]|uniref:hypothetical protein n=1 Tax=Maribellus sp. YY47 TaxID=2929486 RepID=UPI002001ACBD|nr:hypothetical protein [Maribellus sp. YY47]MCK3686376.1 hypothetical protein [Maribellus sp. YY47]
MINVGLIGKTDILEPHALKLKENSAVNIIGKASVGSHTQLNSFHYSVPEFNRVELVERADLILMDNSTPNAFRLMQEMIKKSKHIFCTEHPAISIDECTELNKLANESGSVVQITNPYYFTPAIQWLNENVNTPAFIEYSNFEPGGTANESLYAMLLMLLGITGISPKKIGAVTFPGFNNSKFSNVRLEFSDASVISLNYGKLESLNDFKIRIYADNQFVTFNFTQGTFMCNNKSVNLDHYSNVNEFDHFIQTIEKKVKKNSCLEDYLIAMHVVQKINRKMMQFSSI